MNPDRTGSVLLPLCVAAVLLCCAPGLVAGFGPGSKTEPERYHSSQDPAILDRISVVGERPASWLREEANRVQQRVYNMFNELNADDEYDMVCKKRTYIGSQIRLMSCKPRFQRKAESMAAQDSADDGYLVGDQINYATMRRKHKEQREIMARLANENPEFLDLLKERMALRKAWEAKAGKN